MRCVFSQIWDVNMLILPLDDGSNVVHDVTPIIDKIALLCYFVYWS